MKREAKKKWERPKLIVLMRGKPEEGVLIACKEKDEESSIFAGTAYSVCKMPEVCADCDGNVTS
ncbi:MAG: hypothetical protein P9L93_02755 [Candidatus Gorgyraea atricola]|nr:hypothetical protein [Candidatus Gorgyraea atricola]